MRPAYKDIITKHAHLLFALIDKKELRIRLGFEEANSLLLALQKVRRDSFDVDSKEYQAWDKAIDKFKKVNRTPAQHARQSREFREGGKYAKVNPCYGCGQSAGVNYNSHPLTDTGDWDDIAICLCGKCWQATHKMKDPAEFLAYKKAKGIPE